KTLAGGGCCGVIARGGTAAHWLSIRWTARGGAAAHSQSTRRIARGRDAVRERGRGAERRGGGHAPRDRRRIRSRSAFLRNGGAGRRRLGACATGGRPKRNRPQSVAPGKRSKAPLH